MLMGKHEPESFTHSTLANTVGMAASHHLLEGSQGRSSVGALPRLWLQEAPSSPDAPVLRGPRGAH